MANTTESVEHLTVVTCSDLGIDSDRMKQSEAGENRKIVTKHRGFVTPIYAVSGNVPNIFAKIQAFGLFVDDLPTFQFTSREA